MSDERICHRTLYRKSAPGETLVEVYTDGSCDADILSSSWWAGDDNCGWVLRTGRGSATAEMAAVIAGIDAGAGKPLRLVGDNEQVQLAIAWYCAGQGTPSWRSFRRDSGLARCWAELVERLEDGTVHEVCWTRGHAGTTGNIRANQLARAGLRAARHGLKPPAARTANAER